MERIERVERITGYTLLSLIIFFIMSCLFYNDLFSRLNAVEEEMADMKNKMEVIEGYHFDHSEIK